MPVKPAGPALCSLIATTLAVGHNATAEWRSNATRTSPGSLHHGLWAARHIDHTVSLHRPAGDRRLAATHALQPSHWPHSALDGADWPCLDDMVRAAGVSTGAPFLLVGVLSSRKSYRRRVTVKDTWQRAMAHVATVSVQLRFVLGHDEVCEWFRCTHLPPPCNSKEGTCCA